MELNPGLLLFFEVTCHPTPERRFSYKIGAHPDDATAWRIRNKILRYAACIGLCGWETFFVWNGVKHLVDLVWRVDREIDGPWRFESVDAYWIMLISLSPYINKWYIDVINTRKRSASPLQLSVRPCRNPAPPARIITVPHRYNQLCVYWEFS